MNLLKKLFGGSGGRQSGDVSGLYFYIKSNRTGEVIRVRLHRENDLSLSDGESGYFTRKTIMGQKGFDRIESEFYFDRSKNFVSAELNGGTLVEREDYEAYLAESAPKS